MEGEVWGTQKLFRSYVNTYLASLSTYLSFYDQFAAYMLRTILLIQVHVVAGTTQTDFAAFLLLSVILDRVSQIPLEGRGGWNSKEVGVKLSVSPRPSLCLEQKSFILLPCLGQEIYFLDPNSLCFAHRIK